MATEWKSIHSPFNADSSQTAQQSYQYEHTTFNVTCSQLGHCTEGTGN